MYKRYNVKWINEKYKYRVNEIAFNLNIKSQTVSQWVKEEGLNDINNARLHKKMLIYGSDLKEFLKTKKFLNRNQNFPKKSNCIKCLKEKKVKERGICFSCEEIEDKAFNKFYRKNDQKTDIEYIIKFIGKIFECEINDINEYLKKPTYQLKKIILEDIKQAKKNNYIEYLKYIKQKLPNLFYRKEIL